MCPDLRLRHLAGQNQAATLILALPVGPAFSPILNAARPALRAWMELAHRSQSLVVRAVLFSFCLLRVEASASVPGF